MKAYAAISQTPSEVAVGPGDQYLGAGSWLYSAPHPDIKRLIDVSQIDAEQEWIRDIRDEIHISSATPLGWLAAYKWGADLPVGALFSDAIDGLSSSFKVIDRATFGGNIALSLAKGAMGPVCVALDADYLLRSASGSERRVKASTFQTGSMLNILRPSELLVGAIIPKAHLQAHWTLKRIRMTTTSHVVTSVIGLRYRSTDLWRFSISATLVYPLALDFENKPESADIVMNRIDTVFPEHPYMEDQHGSARYRHAMARHLAALAYQELAES